MNRLSNCNIKLPWLLLIIGCFLLILTTNGICELKNGNNAPSFTLSKIDGGKITLNDYKDQLVILYFWDLSEESFGKYLSNLETFYQKIKDSDVAFLLITPKYIPEAKRFGEETTSSVITLGKVCTKWKGFLNIPFWTEANISFSGITPVTLPKETTSFKFGIVWRGENETRASQKCTILTRVEVETYPDSDKWVLLFEETSDIVSRVGVVDEQPLVTKSISQEKPEVKYKITVRPILTIGQEIKPNSTYITVRLTSIVKSQNLTFPILIDSEEETIKIYNPGKEYPVRYIIESGLIKDRAVGGDAIYPNEFMNSLSSKKLVEKTEKPKDVDEKIKTNEDSKPEVKKYSGKKTIGESYGGGIVFWVDESGQHGLIAATADQSKGIQWYNGEYKTTNANRDDVYAGQYNTKCIIANQGEWNYAAQICANYRGGGYDDWYLPSKYELNLLYQQKSVVGGFASYFYWSSTEFSSDDAWGQPFGNGYQLYSDKDDTYGVRAVRAF